jgi:hypothetical protein
MRKKEIVGACKQLRHQPGDASLVPSRQGDQATRSLSFLGVTPLPPTDLNAKTLGIRITIIQLMYLSATRSGRMCCQPGHRGKMRRSRGISASVFNIDSVSPAVHQL